MFIQIMDFLMKPDRYKNFQSEITILTIDSPATHALKKSHYAF